MLIKRPSDIAPSEITPQGRVPAPPGVPGRRRVAGPHRRTVGCPSRAEAAPLQATKSPLSTTGEPITSLKDITSYNNFYEFGTDKGDPARNAGTLTTMPWTVKVDGLVGKPGDYDSTTSSSRVALEERIYRMRCVEGWSMVIPWVGFPLVGAAEAGRAAGQRQVRRLRDAGAPGRDAGPARRCSSRCRGPTWRACGSTRRCTRSPSWRSASTARRCRTRTARRSGWWCPGSTASRASSRSCASASSRASRRPPGSCRTRASTASTPTSTREVDHPRWSQATERRIGEGGLFAKRRPTLLFNGYGEQVASLYAGMDLQGQLLSMAARRRSRLAAAPRCSARTRSGGRSTSSAWCRRCGPSISGVTDQLGADPQNTLERDAGPVGAALPDRLRLPSRPLRRLGGPSLIRYRRAIGLLAFYYAALHLTVYMVLDQGLDLAAIWADIVKRPYITVGMLAFTAPGAAGGHLQQRHDPPAGRRRLAAAAPAGLRRGRGGGDPLRHGWSSPGRSSR